MKYTLRCAGAPAWLFRVLYEGGDRKNQAPPLIGGGGEIRTHGRVAPSLVFKTSALNHSATPPKRLSVDNSRLAS